MTDDLFQDYLAFERDGLRTQARDAVTRFVASLPSFEQKATWTFANLPTLARNRASRIRHELYDGIILPVLLEGYHRKDPECFYLMGMTYQNLLGYMGRNGKLDYIGHVDLLKRAYLAEPRSQKYRLALLEALLEDFSHSDHEWPSGILGDAYPFDRLKQDVALANQLDEERRVSDRLAEFSHRIEEYSLRISPNGGPL